MSHSESLSSGSSQSQSFSRESLAFEDLLRGLYGSASDAAMQQVADVPLFQDEAQQLFTGGLGFLDQLQALPGDDYLASRLNGPDAAAQAQIDTLGNDLGRFFNEQLMPGITSRGVSTGTLGGDRQAVSIGKAAGEVGGRFSTGVAQILANSQAARDSLALGANQSKIGAAAAGLGALPSVLGLANAGLNAGLNPYLSLSQIIAPTVLGESGAQASSVDISRALSDSYETSQSSSKGKSFNFGIGGAAGGAVG